MNADQLADRFGDSAVAVIGMACRFPGTPDIHKFWRNLQDGVESISFFSAEELAESGVPEEIAVQPNYVPAKGCLDDIEWFDAEFFGFSPREAMLTDVQHRIFLECAWTVMENAGYDPGRNKAPVGVYAGTDMSTYFLHNLYPRLSSSPSASSFQIMLANEKDFLATRTSYKLDLKGPAVNIQTACSTSLTAAHLACQALLSGECDMAMAGGVSVSVPMKAGYLYEEGMIFSKDGHCRAFDEHASGTTAGNGCGVVLLKRLEDAVADEDHIYAVIRGSAANNDGSAKAGFTAPGAAGQAGVIAEALSVADVDPETVTYVETHGTGTVLGDPIEIAALAEAFQTSKKGFCAVGSVKTNIGHLNSAAGAAGLIKTVLSLHHGKIPPSLNFEQPNPRIPFENSPFYVNTRLAEWPDSDGYRRAGVSSFGIGGTNVHIVLEAFKTNSGDAKLNYAQSDIIKHSVPRIRRSHRLIVLSANSKTALDRSSANLAAWFKEYPDIRLKDAAYTLQTGRAEFPFRRIQVCRDSREVFEDPGKPESGLVFEGRASEQAPAAVFMFPGQGAQYANMGRGVYRSEPVFRDEIDRCSDLLKPHTGWDLRDILFSASSGDASRINDTGMAQPALFAVEYALAQLWMARGVTPKAMIGHSVGEYAAACVAGVFRLEDALALVAARGRLMQQLPAGAMMAVSLPEPQIGGFLTGGVCIAAVNGPSLCTVSGPIPEIGELKARLDSEKIPCKRLHTSRAFHSGMVEPVMKAFASLTASVLMNPPAIPYISNLSGTWIKNDESVDPDYYCRHLRSPVMFSQGFEELARRPDQIFLEIGPGRTLCALAAAHVKDMHTHPLFSSLPHPLDKRPDAEHLLVTLGKLWIRGVKIDWDSYNGHERSRRIPLPTYPFERKRFWMEPPSKPAGLSADRESIDSMMLKEAPSDMSPPYPEVETVSRPEAPRNPVEQKVADIFRDLLGVEHIGRQDDFFELGGNSLTAAQILTRLKESFQTAPSLRQFFEHPTIEGVAKEVDNLKGETGASPEQTSGKALPPIEPVPAAEHYPASNAQRRLWLLSRMGSGNEAYNMPWALSIKGRLDIESMRRCFSELIARHESLRTTFILVDDEPMQRIAETIDTPFDYWDLSNVPGAAPRIPEIIRNEALKPFDLENGPLIRARLFKTGNQDYILLVNMHHIISDGWSMSVMIREFRKLYDAFRKGMANPLPPLPIQYKDYARWQIDLLESSETAKHRDYWFNKLSGDIAVLNLPADFSRPAYQTFSGDTVSFRLNAERTRKLRDLARKHRTSAFMAVLAIVKTLLHRYTNQEDIIAGAPTAGRIHPELENQVGFYLNTLALRNQVSGDTPFADLLKQVARTAAEAFDHQAYPFDRLVDELPLRRDISRSPIFDVLVIMQNIKPVDLSLPDLDIAILENVAPVSKYDLTFEFFDHEDEIPVNLKYNTSIYLRERIEIMAGHLETLIDSIAEDDSRPVGDLNMLTDNERIRLLNEFNDTDRDFPQSMTVVDLIEEQVERTPDGTALIFEDRRLTYREFNAGANRIAGRLFDAGAGSGMRIGVLADRSPETAMALLAILKTGAALLGLDPEYPPERIDFMISDASIEMLLVMEKYAAQVETRRHPVIVMDSEDPAPDKLTDQNPGQRIDPNSPAYIVYTSGSTGVPKGALNTHLGLSNQLQWRNAYFGLEPEDRVLHKTPMTFDNSMWELFWPLTAGASAVAAKPGGQTDAAHIRDLIQKHEITTVHFVPSMLRIFMDIPGVDQCASLKRIFSGGEPLPPELLNQCRKRLPARIYNLYGQSETAMNVTAYPCDRYDGTSAVPIGRPIANTRVYITDGRMNLQPAGVPGELHVEGRGVAREYINRPGLTSERFIPNPFRPESGGVLFKTGDMGRWLSSGDIVLSGRNDDQIKIRGFRIGPGEIEQRLMTHDSVRQAAVNALEIDGILELTAYLVLQDGDSPPAPQIFRDHVKQVLPEYMTPSRFIFVASLPLTASGKLDRKKLNPELGFAEPRPETAKPGNEIEARLAVIWAEILGLQTVGIRDNFFDLGGHSLRAARMVGRIRKTFGIEIPLGDIFLHPTIAELADRIETLQKAETGAGESFTPLVPIQAHGRKPPLFFVHIARGDVFCYAALSRALGPDYPFYGLRAFGLDPGTSPLSRIEDMAAAYIEAIQLVHPHGPYIIGGHSRGGVIAYEMAQQFIQRGEPVPALVFIDAFAPDFLERPENLWDYFMQFKHVVEIGDIPEFYSRIRGIDIRGGLDEVRADFLSLSREDQLDIMLEGAKLSNVFEDDIADVDTALQRRIVRVALESGLSVAQYRNMRPYHGRIILFRATDNVFARRFAVATDDAPALGWGRYAGDIEIHDIEGADHASIVQPPHVARLAAKLADCLGNNDDQR